MAKLKTVLKSLSEKKLDTYDIENMSLDLNDKIARRGSISHKTQTVRIVNKAITEIADEYKITEKEVEEYYTKHYKMSPLEYWTKED